MKLIKSIIVASLLLAVSLNVNAKDNRECVFTHQTKAVESIINEKGGASATVLKYDESLFTYQYDFKHKKITMLYANDLKPVGKSTPIELFHLAESSVIFTQDNNKNVIVFADELLMYTHTTFGESSKGTPSLNYSEGDYWYANCIKD